MHLLYTAGHTTYGLAPLLSWLIIIGALYGFVRLAFDLGRVVIGAIVREINEPSVTIRRSPGRDFEPDAPAEMEPAADNLWRHQKT